MTPSERMQTVDRLHATLADVADDMHQLGWHTEYYRLSLGDLGLKIKDELDFLDTLMESSCPDALDD